MTTTMTTTTTKQNKQTVSAHTTQHRETYRCGYCGQFISPDTDGFFDRKDRADECSEVLVFCTELHADANHARRLPQLNAIERRILNRCKSTIAKAEGVK